MRTIDTKTSSAKARQLVFFAALAKKATHTLEVVNLATPGRPRFDIDAVVVER